MTPAGDPLVQVRLEPVATGLRQSRARRTGRAWAAVFLVGLVLVGVDWAGLCRSGKGVLLLVGLVAILRALLVWHQVPLHLLSRTLGSAGLYGSAEFGAILAVVQDIAAIFGGVFRISI